MEFNEVIGEPVLVPGCLHIKETYWNLSKHRCQRPSNLKRAKMFPFHPVSCSAPGLNIACGSLLTESSCHMHRSIVFSFIHEVDVTLSYIRCWPIYIVTTWNNNGRITLFSNFMVHAIWINIETDSVNTYNIHTNIPLQTPQSHHKLWSYVTAPG